MHNNIQIFHNRFVANGCSLVGSDIPPTSNQHHMTQLVGCDVFCGMQSRWTSFGIVFMCIQQTYAIETGKSMPHRGHFHLIIIILITQGANTAGQHKRKSIALQWRKAVQCNFLCNMLKPAIYKPTVLQLNCHPKLYKHCNDGNRVF